MPVVRNSGEEAPAPDASVLTYARFHELCRDYALDNPLDSRCLPQPPVFLAQELGDPPEVSSLPLNAPFATSERLEVDSSAAHVLSSVSSVLRFPFQPPDSDIHPPRLTRRLKVDMPLLRTDHQLDTIRFRKREPCDFAGLTPPFEHTDDERDEGISWPSHCRSSLKDFQADTVSDRMKVPRQALLYLQQVVKRPEVPEALDPTPAKKRAVQHMTPPLLPSSPVFTHVPDATSSSPTGQLKVLSTTTDSTAAEAQALEAEIVEKDRIMMDDAPGLKYCTEDPMLWDDAEDHEIELGPFPPRSRRHAATLKVEAPLTPPAGFPSAYESPVGTANSVSFPINVIRPTTYHMEVPSSYENGNAVLDSENDFDAFFQDDIVPIAKKANWRMENERLLEEDTTRRVEVPRVDFEPPVAPWDVFGLKPSLKTDDISTELEAQARLLSVCARDWLGVAQHWPGSRKKDEELAWWAFPRDLPRTATVEKIQYEAVLRQAVETLPSEKVEIVSSGSLFWKMEGLRILDQQESDVEEIASWDFDPGDDLILLLQKKKLEMENIPIDAVKPRARLVSADEVDRDSRKKQKTTDGHLQNVPGFDNGSMLGELFSASGSVEQYMRVTSGNMKMSRKSETQCSPESPKKGPLKSNALMQDLTKHVTANSESLTPISPLSVPSNLPPKAFIISSQLLIERRGLVRAIQALYTRAILIERDFGKPSTKNSTSISAATATATSGPDLILSPSTGLLITTLQRIKQRALPGNQQHPATTIANGNSNSFQAELAHRAAGVEHLIVFVVSDSMTAHRPYSLDARDCEALAALHGFVSTKTGERGHRISITYVPTTGGSGNGGAGPGRDDGEAVLASWVVSAMAAYGRSSGELAGGACSDGGTGIGEHLSVLKEEESLWELFLRRAGMNAFAAQVVLARLKKGSEQRDGGRSDGHGSTGDAHGLAAFVRMTPQERRKAFEGVVGGRGLLDSVGRKIDGAWATPGP